MSSDPTSTDPDKYVPIFENDWVRVLDYCDHPGQHTKPHQHPNSVMITLSDFQRRLSSGGKTAEVDLTAGRAMWLRAQTHSGHNIGDTDTHVIFVELKSASAVGPAAVEENLGPTSAT
jgi:beta-alanine degradation protein BauB